MCDPLIDPTCVVKSVVGGVSGSIFDQLAKWWSDAFSSMTDGFSKAFLHAGDVSIAQFQSSGLWRLELAVGATIAACGMIWAGASSAWTKSGDPIAAGIAGAIKAVFATAMVFTIVSALLAVADQLTLAVVNASAPDSNAFATKVGRLASLTGMGSGALVFVFAVIGVLITAVLWAEMLIRAAGIVIVTVSTPVGAAGLVSPRTAGWWHKLVTAEVALIFVKPIVALVLAVGFTMSHDSTGIQGVLVGFMVLAAASVAWPVVARMFTFFEGQFVIGGMAAAMGAAGGAAGRFSGAGGRSNGSQPMWQSMEQAASRSGGVGGGSALGTGGGAVDVAVANTPAATGGLGSAAASVGMSAGGSSALGAGAAAGPVAAAALVGTQVAAKAVAAPARAMGRAADTADTDGSPRAESQGTWTRQAQAPPDPNQSGGA